MIIIGGGLAGLAAGVHAQRCGFRTTILEAHGKPGGVCTSWRRGDYLMDVGVKMVIGGAGDGPFARLLSEAGITPAAGFARLEELNYVECPTGERVRFRRGRDVMERDLLDVAPEDRDAIHRLLDALEDFGVFAPDLDAAPGSADPLAGLRALASTRPVARHLARWWGRGMGEWLATLRSRPLVHALRRIYPIADTPVVAMLSSLGWFLAGHVAKPVSGSRSIAYAAADEYRRLGGDLRLASPVDRILVEGGRAVGVALRDGGEERAGAVVGAADGRSTIFRLLGGRWVDDGVRRWYRGVPLFEPIVIVHLGGRRSLDGEPECMHFPISRGIRIGGRLVRHLSIHHSAGNQAFAPEGRCLVRVGLPTDWEHWDRLGRDRDAYLAEKERIAAEVVDRMEERWPGLARGLEVWDVATPLTFVRYTGNTRGAFEGWQATTRTFARRAPSTLPGLGSFYMAGQWVEPGGGVPGVLYSARIAVKRICRDTGRRFVT